MILVTGSAGFIGSHLVTALATDKLNEHPIIHVDKLDYCSTLKPFENLPNQKFFKVDITIFEELDKIMKLFQIDTIIHLAASTHVDNSFKNPVEFTMNNVVGTNVLLEIARKYKIQKFIHVSTDEVYGSIDDETDKNDRTESRKLNPMNPYSASKASAELLVNAYARSFQIPCIIIRGNNVYGPGQYPEKIIPKFICRLLMKKTCFIHGSGNNYRNYIYISDYISALLLLLALPIEKYKHFLQSSELTENPSFLHKSKEYTLNSMHSNTKLVSCPTFPEPSSVHHNIPNDPIIFNITAQFKYTNLHLTHQILSHFNIPPTQYDNYITYVPDREWNDFGYEINGDRIRNLGWKAKVDFEQGLNETVNWYRDNYDKWWNDIKRIDYEH